MQHGTVLSPRRAMLAACAAVAMLGSAHAGAAPPVPGADVPASVHEAAIARRPTPFDTSGSYRHEVQACRSGRSGEALQTCLTEARNAEAARRKGELSAAGVDYTANALERCRPFTGEYRAACEARVLGFGDSSGSVAGGGVLRSVETVVLPPGRDELSFAPRTHEPVVVVPGRGR